MSIEANDCDPAIQTIAINLRCKRLSISALEDGSGVVLDVEREHLFTLNASAIAIMQAIEAGAASTAELVDALQTRFAVSAARAEQDVSRFTSALVASL